MVKRRSERNARRTEPGLDAASARARAEIVGAWEGEEPPGQIAPHCERPDCPAIAAYFSAKRWQDIDPRAMRAAAGASADNPLLFLPPAAVRYFLPAFLVAFLDDRRQLGDFDLVRTLCPHEGWRAWADTASVRQAGAILSFLRYVEKTGGEAPELGSGILFWQRRASA